MLKLQITTFLIACLTFLYGCQEKDKDKDLVITSLELSLSKSRIVADGIDSAAIYVVDQNGINVLKLVNVFFNGNKVSGNKIVSLASSVSTVYAQYNNIKSNELQLEAVEDKNLKFEKNVMLDQYTGTWCGWCPRAIYQINNLQKTDQRIVHAAYHLSDEMTYNMNIMLFQSFGFTGIPTVHADRSIVWSGDAGSITSMHSPSRIGISLGVTGDASKITAAIKVKFGYKFTDGLKLSVYLLHDSLVANQANYYNTDPTSPYYLKGSTMVDFVHRNVVLKSGTYMLGDAIPPASVDIGSIYARNIEFTDFRCDNIKKIIVIALVAYQNGKQIDNVLNCIKAKVGDNKDFAYSVK